MSITPTAPAGPLHAEGRLLRALGGEVSIEIGSVTLFISAYDDEAWIETEPGFGMETLLHLARLAESLGYEVMGEDEAPAEELPNGGLRHYLALIVNIEEEELAAAS